MAGIKDGASIRGLQPEIAIAYVIVESVYNEFETEAILTEGTGAEHSAGSLHYVGYGLDVRIWNIPEKYTAQQVAQKIRQKLGQEFDVVLESNHIHIEYQPKQALNS